MFIAVVMTAAATGCGTVMTSSPSGFLSSYDGLTGVVGERTAARRMPVAIDPLQLTLAEVRWRAPEGCDITEGEQLILRSRLEAALRQEVGTLPAVPQGRPLVLRAAITRVEPVSPALNTVSALLLFVPLDRGGAAVEIEAIDPQTGQQVAAMRAGYFSPMTDLKARFTRLAPAEIALKRAASDFARLLRAS